MLAAGEIAGGASDFSKNPQGPPLFGSSSYVYLPVRVSTTSFGASASSSDDG